MSTREVSKQRGQDAVPYIVDRDAQASEKPPLETFEYITRNFVPKEHNDCLYDGCDCVTCSNESNCGCIMAHGQAYDTANGVLIRPLSTSILECNSNCSCSKSHCPNRVVQHGIRVPLCLFNTDSKGWAVKTLKPIPKGAFVAEYAGEIVGSQEALRRWKERKKKGLCNYILCLREHTQDGRIFRTNIDPTYYGNISRFISHSCEPNLIMQIVRVDSLVPSAALFAFRDIEVGQEITFDYGGAAGLDEPEILSEREDIVDRIKCLCGATQCRGYLPYDPAL